MQNIDAKVLDTCQRCGSCCRKGGPSFHLEDRMLIESGKIPLTHLYTIRKGELVYDNVRGIHLPADGEMIKTKGRAKTWTCLFLDEQNNHCLIYDHRPLECRVLTCWDTRELERIYHRDRLTRKDLISKVTGLWELVRAHQQKCAYDALRKLVDVLKSHNDEMSRQKIGEMLTYDEEIRKLVLEETQLQADQLDFLFGRPLSLTIVMFGLSCTKEGHKYVLRQRH